MTDTPKRTVYSVSAGEYSDYGILDLFEDRADAEAIVARNTRDWYVQEFTLYPAGVREVMIPQKRYSAKILVNGDGKILDHTRVTDWADYPDEEPTRDMVWTHRALWPMRIDGKDVPPRVGQPYEVTAYAATEERARKAASERAAKVASIIIDGGTPKTPY